jgi:hypothetical protein
MSLYIAGEDIPSGSSVVISLANGKAYIAGPIPGEYVGDARRKPARG